MEKSFYSLETEQAKRNALIKKIRAGQKEGDLATLIYERDKVRRELNEMRCVREKSRREKAFEGLEVGTPYSGAWSSW